VTVYTAGIWTVKPGRDDEFVALWREVADWTIDSFPVAQGTLLRSRDEPSRFLSFGPSESIEQIEAWRSAPEWQELVGRMGALLESFEPGTYDVAATVGG
jgi:Antibiotic biosynthesis monooxygenase